MYKATAATPSAPNKTGSAHPSILPALRRRPERVVGIPNDFATLRFAFVTPIARFQLKDNPGIFSFFGILILLFQLRLPRSYSEGWIKRFSERTKQLQILFKFGLFGFKPSPF